MSEKIKLGKLVSIGIDGTIIRLPVAQERIWSIIRIAVIVLAFGWFVYSGPPTTKKVYHLINLIGLPILFIFEITQAFNVGPVLIATQSDIRFPRHFKNLVNWADVKQVTVERKPLLTLGRIEILKRDVIEFQLHTPRKLGWRLQSLHLRPYGKPWQISDIFTDSFEVSVTSRWPASPAILADHINDYLMSWDNKSPTENTE